jgi:AcrR family transcriptional regulator
VGTTLKRLFDCIKRSFYKEDMLKLKSKAAAANAKAAESGNSRKQLLDSGIRLFAQHGLEGTSVRDIAREAGTNICMISYHFGGKEGLYRACLQAFGEARVQVTKDMLKAPSSVEEFRVRLRLFVQTLVDLNADRPEFSRMITKEIEAGLPVAADIFEATFLEVQKNVLQFFRDAQKAGIVRKECDPLYMATIIYGTVSHIARCDTVAKTYFNCSISDPKNREKLVDTLVETFLGGVLKAGQ